MKFSWYSIDLTPKLTSLYPKLFVVFLECIGPWPIMLAWHYSTYNSHIVGPQNIIVRCLKSSAERLIFKLNSHRLIVIFQGPTSMSNVMHAPFIHDGSIYLLDVMKHERFIFQGLIPCKHWYPIAIVILKNILLPYSMFWINS